MTVEWKDPPDARFRTELDTSWAVDLIANQDSWAVVAKDEDQRAAYQLRTNLKSRLTHLHPSSAFELICRRTEDAKFTEIFARYVGVAEDALYAETGEQSPAEDEEAEE